jgi:hypothetical protein
MRGTLRMNFSGTPLEQEYERVTRRLLTRQRRAPLVEAPPPEGYPADVLALCARNWSRRMRQEHDAAAVFAQLVPQFMAAGAPLDVKMALLRSAMDELYHAELCGRLATWMGGVAEVPAELEPEGPAEHDADVPPDEVALRNLLFVGCLSETIAVALLTEERVHCTDPVVQPVLRQLAADETLHARLGWIWLRRQWPGLDTAARARTVDYLRLALGWYEACMEAATPPEPLHPSTIEAAMRLGFADTTRCRDAFRQTMQEVILPQFEAIGLPARACWRDRRRGDVAGRLTLQPTGAA